MKTKFNSHVAKAPVMNHQANRSNCQAGGRRRILNPWRIGLDPYLYPNPEPYTDRSPRKLHRVEAHKSGPFGEVTVFCYSGGPTEKTLKVGDYAIVKFQVVPKHRASRVMYSTIKRIRKITSIDRHQVELRDERGTTVLVPHNYVIMRPIEGTA